MVFMESIYLQAHRPATETFCYPGLHVGRRNTASARQLSRSLRARLFSLLGPLGQPIVRRPELRSRCEAVSRCFWRSRGRSFCRCGSWRLGRSSSGAASFVRCARIWLSDRDISARRVLCWLLAFRLSSAVWASACRRDWRRLRVCFGQRWRAVATMHRSFAGGRARALGLRSAQLLPARAVACPSAQSDWRPDLVLWRPRQRAAAPDTALLYVACATVIGLGVVHALPFGLSAAPHSDGSTLEFFRDTWPQSFPRRGDAACVLYCYAQMVHYWCGFIVPEEDRPRPTPRSFRESRVLLRGPVLAASSAGDADCAVAFAVCTARCLGGANGVFPPGDVSRLSGAVRARTVVCQRQKTAKRGGSSKLRRDFCR